MLYALSFALHLEESYLVACGKLSNMLSSTLTQGFQAVEGQPTKVTYTSKGNVAAALGLTVSRKARQKTRTGRVSRLLQARISTLRLYNTLSQSVLNPRYVQYG